MWEEIMVTFFMGSFMESAMGSIMAWVMRLTPRSVMDLFIMLVMESAIRSVMWLVMESIMESVMQSAAKKYFFFKNSKTLTEGPMTALRPFEKPRFLSATLGLILEAKCIIQIRRMPSMASTRLGTLPRIK